MTIYADTHVGRLAAAHVPDSEPAMVMVWRPHGHILGQYRLERFTDGRLTRATLQRLFDPPHVAGSSE